MTTDYRAMCAELVDSVELLLEMRAVDAKPMAITEDRVSRARALLAQPVAEEPMDEALVSFTAWFCKNYPGPDTIIHKPKWHAPKVFRAAACAIARFGHPTPQPVAEGPTDEELLRVAATAIDPYESSGIALGEYEPETECAVEVYSSELISFARAVLAKWGANAQ